MNKKEFFNKISEKIEKERERYHLNLYLGDKFWNNVRETVDLLYIIYKLHNINFSSISVDLCEPSAWNYFTVGLFINQSNKNKLSYLFEVNRAENIVRQDITFKLIVKLDEIDFKKQGLISIPIINNLFEKSTCKARVDQRNLKILLDFLNTYKKDIKC